jgi:hypothetical protein
MSDNLGTRKRRRLLFAIVELSLVVVGFISVMYARSHGWPGFVSTVAFRAPLALIAVVFADVLVSARDDS